MYERIMDVTVFLFLSLAITCAIEGQVFSDCAGCESTCKVHFPLCAVGCLPRCTCGLGTVLDEAKDKCIPISQCSHLSVVY